MFRPLITFAALIGMPAFAPTAHALSDWVPAFELAAPSENAAEESAAGCRSMNFYERARDPLAEIPIYEQGETDLCYAYTAAQLTEYYLRKSSAWVGDEHVNPLWIAIAYKGGHSRGIRIKNNELGHGFFHTAFKDMADLGICDPKVFERALFGFKEKFADAYQRPTLLAHGRTGDLSVPSLADPDFFFLFEEMWNQRARGDRFFTEKTRGDFREFEAAIEQLAARPDFRRIRDRAFAHFSRSAPEGFRNDALFDRELRRIHDIVMDVPDAWVAKRKKIRYLRDVVFQACTGDALLKPDLPEVKSMGLLWASNRRLKSAIDRMLDSLDPQPIGIGYCSLIYHADDASAKKGAKRNPLLPRLSRTLGKDCMAHYSMIVGRRKSPTANACQYLVRNTYGRDFWTKRYDCLCEKAGRQGFEDCRYSDASPKSDRVVGCWIDEKPLLSALYDVSALRKKNLKPDPAFSGAFK